MRNFEVAPSWRKLLDYDRSELRFCTVIIGAIRVSEHDAISRSLRAQKFEAVCRMVSDFQKRWLSLLKGRSLSGLLWRGEFELELFRDVPPGSHRSQLLESMRHNVSELQDYERWLVVHVHFVTAATVGVTDELKNRLSSEWRGKWQTQVKGLYQSQSTSTAIKKICSYCKKQRMQYSSGGLSDQSVKFSTNYDIVWWKFIKDTYRCFDTEFRSKR